jgi:hypothetical protein
MNTMYVHKKKTPHDVPRTSPGASPKSPLNPDDKKNNHPFVESPKSGIKGDPQSSKLVAKERFQVLAPH